MAIVLQTYTPFRYSHEILDHLPPPQTLGTGDFFKVACKVALLVLNIFALPFIMVAELVVLWPIATLYKWCCLNSPRPSVPAPPLPEAERLLAPPQFFSGLGDNAQFFAGAIQEAFSFLNADEKLVYKELILNDGVMGEQAENPEAHRAARALNRNIDIFQWLAECLLIHYWRSGRPNDGIDPRYPATRPQREYEDAHINTDHQTNMQRLSTAFSPLDRNEMRQTFSLLLHTERPGPDHSQTVRAAVAAFQSAATGITRDPYFLEHILPQARITAQNLE